MFTVGENSTNEETGNGKAVAGFDAGLYFNAGPSRIPHHHELTLHYCREPGVRLQVYNLQTVLVTSSAEAKAPQATGYEFIPSSAHFVMSRREEKEKIRGWNNEARRRHPHQEISRHGRHLARP